MGELKEVEDTKEVRTLRDVIELRQKSNAEMFLLLVTLFERLEALEKKLQSSTSN